MRGHKTGRFQLAQEKVAPMKTNKHKKLKLVLVTSNRSIIT